MQYSVAFNKMAELALALGVRDLNQREGAWIHNVDDQWTIAINGKLDPVRVEIEGGMGATVDPFNAAVFYNGWLAGTMSPAEGVMVNASEDDLIAALDAAVAKTQAKAVAV